MLALLANPFLLPLGYLYAGAALRGLDNRDASNDSRHWGNVIRPEIKGVARAIYWSWDRTGSGVRWNRIGREIH